jgi:hypothetical protein
MVVRSLLILATAIGLAALASLWAPSASADSAVAARIGLDHNGGAPNINNGPAFVIEGGSVDIDVVSRATAPGLGAWEIDIEFDQSVVDASACSTNPAWSQACNPNFMPSFPAPGPDNFARVAGAEIAGVPGTALLVTYTFDATGSAGDCSALAVTVPELTDPASDPIVNLTVSSGQICVVACADLDGDGRVTLRDGLRLLIQILTRRYSVEADLDADGDVDGRDFLIWQRQLGSSC